MFMADSWLCVQESQVGLRGPNWVLGMEPGLAGYKASPFPPFYFSVPERNLLTCVETRLLGPELGGAAGWGCA